MVACLRHEQVPHSAPALTDLRDQWWNAGEHTALAAQPICHAPCSRLATLSSTLVKVAAKHLI
jgi:hypothetical protein